MELLKQNKIFFKKKEGGFLTDWLAPLAASVVQPVISSVPKYITYYVFLVPSHHLKNVEITKYFNYEPRFSGVISRYNLPRIKDEAHVINLDCKQSNGTHWASLLVYKIQLHSFILLELNIFCKKY